MIRMGIDETNVAPSASRMIVGRLFLGPLALGELLLQICGLLGASAMSRRLRVVHGLGRAFSLDVFLDRLLAFQFLCRGLVEHGSGQ
jgi:hypothetical protein